MEDEADPQENARQGPAPTWARVLLRSENAALTSARLDRASTLGLQRSRELTRGCSREVSQAVVPDRDRDRWTTGLGSVAIRDTAVTARHSGELAFARLLIELIPHGGGSQPPRSCRSSRSEVGVKAAKRRVFEGSLDAQAERRLSGVREPRGDAAAPGIEPAFPRLLLALHRRSSRCSVGRSSSQVASSAPIAETPPPRFDGSSKQGAGVVGRSQLLVAVAGARRSPCAVRLGEIRAARCVAVVVFVVLGGAVAGGGVARGAGGLVCLLVGARQRTRLPLVGSRQRPPTARRRAGSVPPRARPRRAECGGLRGGTGGSFFTSSPGSILASVEGLSHQALGKWLKRRGLAR